MLNIIYSATLGAFGAGVGYVLGRLLSKIKHKSEKKIIHITTITCLVIAIMTTKVIAAKEISSYDSEVIIKDMKKQRVFAVLFASEKGAEEELKNKISYISKKYNGQKLIEQVDKASSDMVLKYFNKYLAYAPDDIVYKVIQRNIQVLKNFNKNPEMCVGYYLGNYDVNNREISRDFINKELDLKADVIEGAIKNRSLSAKAPTQDDIGKRLAFFYQKKGYDINNIAKVPNIPALGKNEGCRIATEFSDVMASMDMRQSVYVLKNLIYLSNGG